MPTPLQFLRESGVRPMHRRGQNFLIDKNVLKKIVAVAGVKKTDTIVEIGSGSGELTCELAARAKKVLAVEIDKNLFEILDSRFFGKAGPDRAFQRGSVRHDGSDAQGKNITLFKDDIRAIPNITFGKKDGSYRVIANIPYHITSQIVRKFLEHSPRPKDLILLMQKEVARRIIARPPQMSLLAVSVQYYADAKVLFSVSRHSFFPKPAVDSAVVRLAVRKILDPRVKPGGNGVSHHFHKEMVADPISLREPEDDREKEYVIPVRQLAEIRDQDSFFFSIVRAGFSAKRKQCAQSISKKLRMPLPHILYAFQKAGVGEKARAQEISIEQWRRVIAELIPLNSSFVVRRDAGSSGHPPAGGRG